jgi:hypothetical protein
MKRFDHTGLWAMLRTLEQTTGGLDADAVLNEFMTEVHDYCRHESSPAQRTRTLRFARSELSATRERLNNGAKKKCAVAVGH